MSEEKQFDFSNIINSLTEEFNQKLEKVQKKLDKEFDEIKKYYSGMMTNLQMQLLLNKMSENKIKELEEKLDSIRNSIKLSDDKLKDVNDINDNDEMMSFKRNLNVASKIVETWTPEQKIHNSIGYPKQ